MNIMMWITGRVIITGHIELYDLFTVARSNVNTVKARRGVNVNRQKIFQL